MDPGITETIQPFRVEEQPMYDNSSAPDLTGDDVKTVGYWITFQKPDYETTLQDRRDETIDYSTTAKAFAAQKLMDFMARLSTEGIPIPANWDWDDLPSKGYVVKRNRRTRERRLFGIPLEDRRYIDAEVVLTFRRPKQDPNYDRQKVEILREIRDK
jgi:hypothetical protein